MKDLNELLIMSVLVILACFGCYKVGQIDGRDEIQAFWDADHAKMMQANSELIQQHAIELQHERDKQLQTNLKTDYEHTLALQAKDADIAAARADVARRGGLRVQGTCVPSGSTGTAAQTTGTGKRDETIATEVELPQRVQDDLWNLVSRADAVVEQARACQNWIKDNGFSP